MKTSLSLLLTALLLLIHAPGSAQAYTLDEDVPRCGNDIHPIPWWWWTKVGLPDRIAIRDWDIVAVGDNFDISFEVINATDATIREGTPFAVTHAAVDPTGHADPGALAVPASASALLGTEALVQGTLPTLAPGQSVSVRARARSFRTGANHVLTLVFHDNAQSAFTAEPIPVPWTWLRLLRPGARGLGLRTVAATAEVARSSLPGYAARRITVTLANAGSEPLREGTPITMVHGNGAAVGYWSPEDDRDPNDPGNPYAVVFREVLSEARLERAVAPGEHFTVTGTAYLPEGHRTLQQVTVRVGP